MNRWSELALSITALLCLLCGCATPLAGPQTSATSDAPSSPGKGHNDYVVMVHGLDCTAISFVGMENALARQGYNVLNIEYHSSRMTIQQASDNWLAGLVSQRATNPAVKIHFVTHSMGGLVVRQYLHDRSLPNLGRVVMMAPPNHGSVLADMFKGNFLFRWIAGPAGQQLGTTPYDLPEKLGPVNFELGVIAGDRSLHPIFSAWLGGPNDGKVSVESTKVEGMKDFLVVHHTHTWMMWKKDVIDAVARFLAEGHFVQPDNLLAQRTIAPLNPPFPQ